MGENAPDITWPTPEQIIQSVLRYSFSKAVFVAGSASNLGKLAIGKRGERRKGNNNTSILDASKVWLLMRLIYRNFAPLRLLIQTLFYCIVCMYVSAQSIEYPVRKFSTENSNRPKAVFTTKALCSDRAYLGRTRMSKVLAFSLQERKWKISLKNLDAWGFFHWILE